MLELTQNTNVVCLSKIYGIGGSRRLILCLCNTQILSNSSLKKYMGPHLSRWQTIFITRHKQDIEAGL